MVLREPSETLPKIRIVHFEDTCESPVTTGYLIMIDHGGIDREIARQLCIPRLPAEQNIYCPAAIPKFCYSSACVKITNSTNAVEDSRAPSRVENLL